MSRRRYEVMMIGTLHSEYCICRRLWDFGIEGRHLGMRGEENVYRPGKSLSAREK